MLFWHLVLVITGATSSIWAAEWGGFLSDLSLFAVAWGFLRKHNCEVHGCWRLGRHITAGGHNVCRVHHPDDHLSADDVLVAHQSALEGDTVTSTGGS